MTLNLLFIEITHFNCGLLINPKLWEGADHFTLLYFLPGSWQMFSKYLLK